LLQSAKYWRRQSKKRPKRGPSKANAAHPGVVLAVQRMIEITRRANERETGEGTKHLTGEIVAKIARGAKMAIKDMRHKGRETPGEGVRNGSMLSPARKRFPFLNPLKLTLLQVIDRDLPPRMTEPRTIIAQKIGIEIVIEKVSLRERLTAIA